MVPKYNTGGGDTALLPSGSGYTVVPGELVRPHRDVFPPGSGGRLRRLSQPRGRTVSITGTLRVTGVDRATADAAMTAAIEAIEELKTETFDFKCDAYSGGLTNCALDGVRATGRREYSKKAGGSYAVLQDYAIQITQLDAGA